MNPRAIANRIIETWQPVWYEVPHRQELQDLIAAAIEAEREKK